ncbi:antiviral reverse transcriptase Drt5 [Photobacterium alginatilyticum]|uniref:antiviral reverse transcriptase Drt5 n=1 Tax=Photobacterium alginatilyticum TaxID=1775171 RepID=UPI004067B440
MKEKVLELYNSDFEGTLFPMETCRVIIENAYDELVEYIKKIANPDDKAYCFLPQQVVYASKSKQHLRRTKKLDPVAEFYIYEMAYEHRNIFNRPQQSNRESLGYRFKEGKAIPINESFIEFNKRISDIKDKYQYFIQFDISSYFNSIYHHDLVNWFASCGVSTGEVELFGQFMREINAGFSIDFMPHGIYPSKMLGSHFLSYIDYSMLIKSEQMVRFMDDFIIASDSKEAVTKDFLTIQKLLGQKSLNINSHKTQLYADNTKTIDNEVDAVINDILGTITVFHGSDVGYEEFDDVMRELNPDEVAHLIGLLDKINISDREASLVLETIRNFTNELHSYLPNFFHQHPNLIKKVYAYCGFCSNKEDLAKGFFDLLSSDKYLNEYQLFWLGKIVETHLLRTSSAGNLLSSLYGHKDATVISKAKILEIPEHRFGLPELRETHLKNGSSGWLAWSSAVGMRNDTKQAKNYLMDYFSKVSPINKLIGDCIKKM